MENTFITDIERFARQLPFKSPPIPVGHPLIGKIGECVPGRGFIVKGMSYNTLNALLRDEERFRRNPKKALRELGAINTWNDILSARANGKADDRMFSKASQTTVAAAWSAFFRSTGFPGAGAYTNIPGGAAHNVASAGAFPLTNPTSPNKKYLLNFGLNHPTGTNIVLLLDLLVAAGNIVTTSASAQTVNSTVLTRYTDGVGVMMILEVTTALGTGASNITITYTNQAGTGSRSTGAIAMTTSAIVYRLQPISGGTLIPLQAEDSGVKSVQTIQFSAAMSAGVVALLLYKPLLLMPTISSATMVERSTPGMLGGIAELVTEAGGNLGCLTVFALTSGTSTGIQTYFLQTCEG